MFIVTKVFGRENRKLDIAIYYALKTIVLNYNKIVITNSFLKISSVNLIFGSMVSEFACWKKVCIFRQKLLGFFLTKADLFINAVHF